MVMPYDKGNNSMFQADHFDLKSYVKNYKKKYGVSPRPHWISAYYGGHVCTFSSHLHYFLHKENIN
jgi:lysosomal Pro-X carboxypeptidase